MRYIEALKTVGIYKNLKCTLNSITNVTHIVDKAVSSKVSKGEIGMSQHYSNITMEGVSL